MTDLSAGACAGLADSSYAETDPFYPEPQRGRPTGDPYEAARKVCARCTLRDACLEEALIEPAQWGFRAGMTEAERQSLKRRQQRANPLRVSRSDLAERGQLYEAGWSDAAIAAQQGVTSKTILTWRTANGYPSNQINHRVHTPQQNALKVEMWEAGATDPEIAAAVPCNADAIRKWRYKTGRKANNAREKVPA